MAKYLGNAMILKVETSPGGGTFATVGGSSSHTLAWGAEQINVSDKDSSRFDEYLAAGGRSLTISMDGIVSDNANFKLVEAAVEGDVILAYQMLYGDSKTIESNFHIGSFEVTGERNGAQTFTCSLTNSGVPTVS